MIPFGQKKKFNAFRRNAVPRPQILLIAGLLTFLGSCGGTLRQPQISSSVDLPPRFVESLPENSNALEFWRGLGGEELLALQEEAMGNNLELSMALARLDAAGQEARMVGADRLPSVSASLSSGRQKQNFIGFPIPGSEGGVLTSTTSSSGVSFSVQWEVGPLGAFEGGSGRGGPSSFGFRSGPERSPPFSGSTSGQSLPRSTGRGDSSRSHPAILGESAEHELQAGRSVFAWPRSGDRSPPRPSRRRFHSSS